MRALLTGPRRRLLIDIATALGAFLVLVLPIAGLELEDELPAIGWSTLMVSALAWRRVNPLWAVAICAAAGTGMVIQLTAPTPAIFVVLVIVYTSARYLTGPSALVVIPIGIAAAVVGPLSWLARFPDGQRLVGAALLIVTCLALQLCAYLLGRQIAELHTVRNLEQVLAEERFLAGSRNTQQASELADGKARAEVARELHDVVAHSLSVIVVQAEGAKALATKKPEAAVEALSVIARTGRSSIGEMRRIVSLLRGESDAAFGPTPSLPQIPEMVAKAGPRIQLEMADDVPTVPDSLGLTAFRVVQESVTNFLKHAGPTAQAVVVVAWSAEAIDIRVSDDGVGGHVVSDGRGAGLRGMRERVATMGGTFTAGPRTGGGYEVKAHLPLPSQLGRSWLK